MREPFAAIEQYLLDHELAPYLATLLAHALVIGIVLLVAAAVNFVAKRILLRAIRGFIARTQTAWDDYFLEHRVFDRLSHLAPAMVIYASAGLAFPDSDQLQSLVRHLAVVYMAVFAAVVVDGVLNGLEAIYSTLEVARTRPIRTYVQMVKILVFLAVGIFVVASLTGRSPWGLLSGLGAMTAILMLVFKDTILGLVASIQLTAHDMVRPGDWIEMSKFGADGNVTEVTLNTVKVRNWDKTITTVPTYALVSESFKNWRGMSESGGRRIKRALWLDQTSVEFCDETTLDRLEKLDLIRDYVRDKRRELKACNVDIDMTVPGNGRRMTNFGTFRMYVLRYLQAHPKVHKELTLLVRHVDPGPTGIGLEVYCFSNDQVWANYEAIQADIFDHLLAVMPIFGLRVFQSPTGSDVKQALAHLPT